MNMPFTFVHTPLNGVIRIEPKIFLDNRGYFKEAYKESEFKKSGIDLKFVQDNHSFSKRGVVRGLHFQKYPNEQGKLISVLHGEIFDVAVDLRPESKTYSKWFAVILSEQNGNILWIPAGFAHGFQALKDSHVYYKVTTEFSPIDDSGIRWDDPTVAISWPIVKPIVSEKDSKLPYLADLNKTRSGKH